MNSQQQPWQKHSSSTLRKGFYQTLLALDEISLAWNIKSDLKKRENTLSPIKAVLMDAGKQQAKNHEVKDWLEKLQDVVYDVDDLWSAIIG